MLHPLRKGTTSTSSPSTSSGHGQRLRDAGGHRSPFGALRPVAAVACGYAGAALLWAAGGTALPGGRWLAVHLFTLGVLTNLVVALTHHFAQTLLHARNNTRLGRLLAVNAGVVMVLTGLPSARQWLVAGGATVLTASVLWLYADLRRMRKASLNGRFVFVVRTYERACGAFVHGALLGALMGLGIMTGSWYAAARMAHLHVNVLGWGGLTLLATIVFFGPTVMRARMEPGADAAAAIQLRRAAAGLTVATLALLATGAGGAVVLPARLVAAGGLAVYALGAVRVCAPVVRLRRRARPSYAASMMRAGCWWFVAAAITDVAVVATGHLRLLPAVGTAMLVGVLGQTVLASLAYLVPMAWTPAPHRRTVVSRRHTQVPWLRPLALNAGVALVVTAATGAVGGQAGATVARLGWLLVISAIAVHVALLAVTMVRGAAPARG